MPISARGAWYIFGRCHPDDLNRGTESHIPCNRYFVYFTHLSYIGLAAYFCASSVHTAFFMLDLRRLRLGDTSRGLSYPLQKWGKFLQLIHLYLYCTSVTFGRLAPSDMQSSTQPNLNPRLAPLVTVVYWAILKDDTTFDSPLNCSYFSWTRHHPEY